MGLEAFSKPVFVDVEMAWKESRNSFVQGFIGQGPVFKMLIKWWTSKTSFWNIDGMVASGAKLPLDTLGWDGWPLTPDYSIRAKLIQIQKEHVE